jgi:hypothetical protein
MFCTLFSFPLSDKEIDALKKADTFTVRFEDWDLPCTSWGEGKRKLGSVLFLLLSFRGITSFRRLPHRRSDRLCL